MLSRIGMGYVRKLMRGYAELLCEYLPVARRLVEQVYEVRVFGNVLSKANVQNQKKYSK
jgi:hypothetical protein